MPVLILLGLLLLGALLWAAWRYCRRRRRDWLYRQPLPEGWAETLQRNVPVYCRLPEALRQSLHGLVRIFLDEKHFEGCAGLAISDEIRVTVAGNACLLLLGGQRQHFPGFHTVLVYPDAFVAPQTHYDGLIEVREDSLRSGESWHRGPVVLAWADIREDVAYPDRGRNVVLHELAHKLDEESNSMDGLPLLQDRAQYAEWAGILGREYETLRHQVRHGDELLLDAYGAESPAEFFAVATETFFQSPALMQRRLPDLYDQLRRFYRLDPDQWRG